jgi:hypothetical protein
MNKPRLTDKVLKGLDAATDLLIQDIQARSGDDDPMYSKEESDAAYRVKDWVREMKVYKKSSQQSK